VLANRYTAQAVLSILERARSATRARQALLDRLLSEIAAIRAEYADSPAGQVRVQALSAQAAVDSAALVPTELAQAMEQITGVGFAPMRDETLRRGSFGGTTAAETTALHTMWAADLAHTPTGELESVAVLAVNAEWFGLLDLVRRVVIRRGELEPANETARGAIRAINELVASVAHASSAAVAPAVSEISRYKLRLRELARQIGKTPPVAPMSAERATRPSPRIPHPERAA